MNQAILSGRLTADPKVTYTQSETPLCIAKFTLAINRKFKRDGQPDADFISCVAMGKTGESAEKYFHKGTKIEVRGHIQTGSYTNRDGNKVYTTDVMIDEWEFAESKAASQQNTPQSAPAPAAAPQSSADQDFMSVPDTIDEELPFK